jgi:hypothetical protein
MKLTDVKTLTEAKAINVKDFSMKDLGPADLEQALKNGGYEDMTIESAKFHGRSPKGAWIFTVDYKDDGSFNTDSERKNQKLFVELDAKSGKITADF